MERRHGKAEAVSSNLTWGSTPRGVVIGAGWLLGAAIQRKSFKGLAMAKSYKPRRNKLKSHDSGEDRHNKGVAYENKAVRLAAQHQRTVSGMRRTGKGRQKKVNILKQLEAFDAQHADVAQMVERDVANIEVRRFETGHPLMT